MLNKAVLENHYGADVWTNKEMDELRKTECLCHNCNKGYCPAAKYLYEHCKQFDLALIVTRCKQFEAKQ